MQGLWCCSFQERLRYLSYEQSPGRTTSRTSQATSGSKQAKAKSSFLHSITKASNYGNRLDTVPNLFPAKWGLTWTTNYLTARIKYLETAPGKINFTQTNSFGRSVNLNSCSHSDIFCPNVRSFDPNVPVFDPNDPTFVFGFGF